MAALRPLPVQAADDAFCAEYGAIAVAQLQQQSQNGCGFGGPEWNPDEAAHSAWCRRVPQATAEAGTRFRVDALKRCLGATPAFGENAWCARYSVIATHQQQENLERSCKFSGPEWNGDPLYHYRWCVGAAEQLSRSGMDDRRISLAKCGGAASGGGALRIVAVADKSVTLSRPAFAIGAEALALDKDHDGIIDTFENLLAEAFRPLLVFDSDERHRRPQDPLVLFQVIPKTGPSGEPGLRVLYALIFPSDAYGPDAGVGCNLETGSHKGDVETMTFDLASDPAAQKWQLVSVRVAPWRPGPAWPASAKLQLQNRTHPLVYLSASKHHLYLDTSHNHDDSLYSDPPFPFDECNDDVNGKGAQVLADVRSVGQGNALGYNNVGEALDHDVTYFVNGIDSYYPGHDVWGPRDFFESGRLSRHFLKPNAMTPQPLLLPQLVGERVEAQMIEGKKIGPEKTVPPPPVFSPQKPATGMGAALGVNSIDTFAFSETVEAGTKIVRLRYRIAPKRPGEKPLYAGAWLLGPGGADIGVGYQPQPVGTSGTGEVEIRLSMPDAPVKASLLRAFLLQNGRVIVQRDFPVRFSWGGKK